MIAILGLATLITTGAVGQPSCLTPSTGAGTFARLVEYTGSPNRVCKTGTTSVSVLGKSYLFERSFLFGALRPGVNQLNAFCALTVLPPGQWPPSMEDLETALRESEGMPQLQVGYDLLGLSLPASQEGLYPTSVWRYHAARFLHAIGAVKDLHTLPQPAHRPRIVLVDSAPTASDVGWTTLVAPSYAKQNHGVALARIMEKILCKDGNPYGACAAEIASVQAIRRQPNGDQRGSLGDLAQAIVAAVDDVPANTPLILNLSVGWHAPSYGELEQPAGDAVLAALQYARCQGAAILGSTGNRIGAEDQCYEDEAMFPARWSSQIVSATMCANTYAVATLPPGYTFPLMTTVSAINDQGRLLGLHRPLSQPSFVANGLRAVVPTASWAGGDSGVPTATLSGTSVSTAITSAVIPLLMAATMNSSAQNVEALLPGWAGGSGGQLPVVHVADMIFRASGLELDRLVPVPPAFPPRPPATRLSTGGAPLWCPTGTGLVEVRGPAGLPPARCNDLVVASIDEDLSLNPQPPPLGENCPAGCQMLNVNGVSQFLIEVPIPNISFTPLYLEVEEPSGTTYFYLPNPLSAPSIYQIALSGSTPFDPASTTVRLISLNPANQTLMATEVFLVP